jgi:hypothetical protein
VGEYELALQKTPTIRNDYYTYSMSFVLALFISFKESRSAIPAKS